MEKGTFVITETSYKYGIKGGIEGKHKEETGLYLLLKCFEDEVYERESSRYLRFKA